MSQIVPAASSISNQQPDPPPSPWLTAAGAARRAQLGSKAIYAAVRSGRLRAARIGGRRQLRFHVSWVDEWLASEATATR